MHTQTQKQTQYAHNMHNTENTEYNTETKTKIYAAHRPTHRTTHRTTHREQHTENSTQPQHRCSTYDLHKYSFDLYHEYVAIKNSNTIELYTILQDNV